MSTTLLASFPSPSQGVWHLGPFPLRAYALFIIIGIIAALVIGDRRWEARGGERGVIYDIALWAVPFGLIGGRLYHVLTDWPTYFGADGAGPAAALRIWDGGLGIWGAVALGAVGAWIGCKRRGIPLPAFGDAIAPGIVLAQAIGRLGNYFNQELYGRPTDLPWGLEIFYRRDPSGIIDVHSLNGVSTGDVAYVVHPTFLYELIWNLIVFAVLLYVDRRFKIGHGRLFALYVAGYCIGRFGVELMRDDFATLIAGIRINSFTATFVFIAAIVYFILAPKGREAPETLRGTSEARADDEQTPAEGVEKELVKAAATTGVVAAATVAVKEETRTETVSDGDAPAEDKPTEDKPTEDKPTEDESAEDEPVATDADDIEAAPEDQAILEAEVVADDDVVIESAAVAEDAQLIDEDHDPVDEDDLEALWGEADEVSGGPVSEQQEELGEPDAKAEVDEQAAAEEEAAEGEALIEDSEGEPSSIDDEADLEAVGELADLSEGEVSGGPVSEQQESLGEPDAKAEVDEQAAAEEEAAEGEALIEDSEGEPSSIDDEADLEAVEELADLSEGEVSGGPVSEQQESLGEPDAKAEVDEQAAAEEEAAEGEADDLAGEQQPSESQAPSSDYTVVTTPPPAGPGPVSRLGRLIRRRRG